MCAISTIPLEEESDATRLECLGHCSGYRSLPRASLAIQPEYALTGRVIRPLLYLLEKMGSSVWKASLVRTVGVRVTDGVLRDRQVYGLRGFWEQLAHHQQEMSAKCCL